MPKPIRKLSESKSLSTQRLVYFIPAVLWGLLIVYFSLLPGNRVPDLLRETNDKFIHGLIYFVSAGLIYLGFVRYNFNNPLRRGVVITTVLLCVFLGAIIEILQHYWVLNRDGDWNDFVANSVGSVVCVFLFVIFHRVKT